MPFLPDMLLLGSFPLPTVALTGLLGGLLAYLLAGWQAKRDGSTPDGAQELILDLFIGGVLGAKLIYVVLDLGSYVANPASLIIFPYGPLALPGALVGAVALGAWGMRKEPNRLALFDQVMGPVVLGLAVATTGWVVPGSWSFAPLLGVGGLGALITSLRENAEARRPGRRAAEAIVFATCALVLADVARPGTVGTAGISLLQWTAVASGTLAYIWTRRIQPES